MRLLNGQMVVLPDYPAELLNPDPSAFAACYVCGERRGRQDDPAAWRLNDRPIHRSGPTGWVDLEEGGREERYAPQPWRDRHAACDPSSRAIIRTLVGIDLDDADAARLHADSAVPLTAVEANKTGRTDYSWLTTKQVDALRYEALRVLHKDEPRRYVGGRCAACGVSRARRWVRLPGELRWPGGDRPAVCGDCADVLATGDRYDLDDVRTRVLSRAAGMAYSRMSTPTGRKMRLAIERLTAEQRHEREHRAFDYAPDAVAALVKAARQANPSLVLDPLKRRIAAVQLARAEANAAAEAQQQEAAADPLAALW